LRALIEAKLEGLPLKPGRVVTPSPVIDLIATLKRFRPSFATSQQQPLDRSRASPSSVCRLPRVEAAASPSKPFQNEPQNRGAVGGPASCLQ